MKTKYFIIILVACGLRILGQMMTGDFPYFLTRGIFDIAALHCILSAIKEELRKNIILFILGLAYYDLFDYLFLNPFEIDIWEYTGFGAGLILLIIKYVVKKKPDTTKRPDA